MTADGFKRCTELPVVQATTTTKMPRNVVTLVNMKSDFGVWVSFFFLLNSFVRYWISCILYSWGMKMHAFRKVHSHHVLLGRFVVTVVHQHSAMPDAVIALRFGFTFCAPLLLLLFFSIWVMMIFVTCKYVRIATDLIIIIIILRDCYFRVWAVSVCLCISIT